MLHSIIPSFVRWTKRARGTGLKKDRHTVRASDPGETPADTEVSEKTRIYTEPVCTVLSGRCYFLCKGTSYNKPHRLSGDRRNCDDRRDEVRRPLFRDKIVPERPVALMFGSRSRMYGSIWM